MMKKPKANRNEMNAFSLSLSLALSRSLTVAHSVGNITITIIYYEARKE